MTGANATYREERDSQARDRGALASLLAIFAGFTLTSTAYLSWLYHLMSFVSTEAADALTLIGGYGLQAAGIAIVAVIGRRWPAIYTRVSFVLVVALHFACAVPATMGTTVAGVVAFGYAMNVLCGAIAAFYLRGLSAWVPARRRGTVFGGGYASSIIVTWLLSRMVPMDAGGVFGSLAPCLVLSVLAVLVVFIPLAPDDDRRMQGGDDAPKLEGAAKTFFVFSCFVVLLMSLVKNVGFSFPTADLAAGVDIELSRMFYAVGLVVAGVVMDRSRKYGLICCMAALVTPFACMALANEPVPGTVMWAVDYFFFGFFSVFRSVLFADIAADARAEHLSGFGLMVGRVGDAMGTAVCLTLAGSSIALVVVAAALFAATVFFAYRLIALMDRPGSEPAKTERQLLEEFAFRYGLSARECDVLRLLVDGRSNGEIAAELFVTESTVKFHVRNLLKKSGCKNRQELRAVYAQVEGSM